MSFGGVQGFIMVYTPETPREVWTDDYIADLEKKVDSSGSMTGEYVLLGS